MCREESGAEESEAARQRRHSVLTSYREGTENRINIETIPPSTHKDVNVWLD